MAMQITQVFIIIVVFETLLSKISCFLMQIQDNMIHALSKMWYSYHVRLKDCENDDPEPST